MRNLGVMLGLCAALLTVTHLALALAGGSDRAPSLQRMFDLDAEQSVPAFYSGLLMMLTAIVLADEGLVRRADGRAWRVWFILSLAFAFFCVDETTAIHENLRALTLRTLSMPANSDVFLWAWVIPYGAAVIFVSPVLFLFLRSMQHRTRLTALASGALYLSGVLGMEIVGASRAAALTDRMQDVPYIFASTAEEALELAGLSLFLWSLSIDAPKSFRGSVFSSRMLVGAAVLVGGAVVVDQLHAPLARVFGEKVWVALSGALLVLILSVILSPAARSMLSRSGARRVASSV